MCDNFYQTSEHMTETATSLKTNYVLSLYYIDYMIFTYLEVFIYQTTNKEENTS